MQFLETLPQLYVYRNRLDQQMECLCFAKIFTLAQRNDLLQCYNNAIAICDNRIKELEKMAVTDFLLKP